MRIILFVWLYYQLSFCTPFLVLKNTKDRTFLVYIKVCYNYSISVFRELPRLTVAHASQAWLLFKQHAAFTAVLSAERTTC